MVGVCVVAEFVRILACEREWSSGTAEFLRILLRSIQSDDVVRHPLVPGGCDQVVVLDSHSADPFLVGTGLERHHIAGLQDVGTVRHQNRWFGMSQTDPVARVMREQFGPTGVGERLKTAAWTALAWAPARNWASPPFIPAMHRACISRRAGLILPTANVFVKSPRYPSSRTEKSRMYRSPSCSV